MAKCFFNNNYEKSYDCEYYINDKTLEVHINYDIKEELPSNCMGVSISKLNDKFKNRDLLIVDYRNKKNYLMKDAFYYGHSSVYGTLDSGTITRFRSNYYFQHSNYDKLINLSRVPKVKSFKIFSSSINEIIGHPSIIEENKKDELILTLKKIPNKRTISISKNNIKEIQLFDNWSERQSYITNDILIKLSGCLQVTLNRVINYDSIYEFIREIELYLQLYRPDKFRINIIEVLIDEDWYTLNVPLDEPNVSDKLVNISVDDNFESFIKKCYYNLPYRESKTEIRNIPYIIFNHSRNIEDIFLMLFKFVECYYKKQKLKNVKYDFIKYAIEYNYNNEVKDIENAAQEIKALRNHYVHEGYYINKQTLEITFNKIGKKSNPKNYTLNNVDFDWIYEKTKMLYTIVIDIIFKNMLKYGKYRFDKNL